MGDKSKKLESFSDVKETFLLIPDFVGQLLMTKKHTLFHANSIRTGKTLMLLCGVLLLLSGCNPRIYKFEVSPLTIGPNDTVNLNWVVKGDPVLLIHDVNYPASGTAGLAAITLVDIQNGKTLSYTLHAADTLKLQLATRGSLRIAKKKRQYNRRQAEVYHAGN